MGRLHDVARHGSGGTTYFSSTPPLSLDASPEVWPLLREARDAGIEVLPGEGVTGPVRRRRRRRPRARSSSGPPTAAATSTSSSNRGDLPAGTTGERLFLGDPVHAVAVEGDDGSLTFVPLDQDLDLGPEALASALAGLRVPADERGRFLRSVVPGLRQRLRVRSEVPLPAPELPRTSGSPRSSRCTSASSATCPASCASTSATPTTARPRPVHDGPLRHRRRPRPRRRVRRGARRDLAALDPRRPARRPRWRHAYLVPRVVLTGLAAARFVVDTLPLLEADEHVTVEVDGERPRLRGGHVGAGRAARRR